MLKLQNLCLFTAADTSACCLQEADKKAAQDATHDLWKRAEAITQAAPVVSAYDASQAHQQFAGAEALSRSACLFVVVKLYVRWLQQCVRSSHTLCYLEAPLWITNRDAPCSMKYAEHEALTHQDSQTNILHRLNILL